ncbi:MAG: helix-turn-helix domain-containing protein [Elioraea sp.]|nr:helix-turn-helix domain-containing protein [Elioraea sp.]
MLPAQVARPERKRNVFLPPRSPAGEDPASLIKPLADVEREAIERAIALCGGNIAKAAAHLGVSPSTIYRKRAAWIGESPRPLADVAE